MSNKLNKLKTTFLPSSIILAIYTKVVVVWKHISQIMATLHCRTLARDRISAKLSIMVV